MERYRGKKILIVGLGRTGFSLINFFNQLGCEIRVTDIKPIFDLNKAVKKLKRIRPTPLMTFGEHKEEDFIEADVVVYCSAVDPNLPQLEVARQQGVEVYSEFAMANKLCNKPIIAVSGSFGRTTIAHMIGYTLKLEGKNVFVCGNSETPFIEFCAQPNYDEMDYVVVEVSAEQLQGLRDFRPRLVVYPNISDRYPEGRFRTVGDYIETKLSIIKNLSPEDYLIVNFDTLSNNTFFRNAQCQTFWYSRRSFVKMGVMNEVQGTHFHDKRIHSNVHYHSEFRVSKMRIIGQENRENLLAAITACKALNVSDKSIQTCIEKFPGIPNRLEFIIEKNGVQFYNDSKSEIMPHMIKSLESFKNPVILIAGGKDQEEDYERFRNSIPESTRVLVLVGECKERLNRAIGENHQTYLVGSFEESILIAYQKSRTGDTILLSPGNSATDTFRDYEERGSYYKKLIYQL
jgi:UDP-N-acetylmuramoylalanine--D-glutamate ligase